MPVELRCYGPHLTKTPLSLRAPTFEVDNEVAVSDGGQTVGDGHGGDGAFKFLQSFGDRMFGFSVEGAGGLIED